ncbi:hypothetical protein [Acuticoccus kandeliae]|uniref:hypothetical protein n=1 Tax=Acuticoccus kandeliae TaxID=2073160 RepID=UPI000D3E05AA|nr:hypothetical protein [Acuticoccus kandeliae]
MPLFGPRPPYSVLYAAGDSLTDYNNYIPLITPPGMDETLREQLLYSLSITNLQGDLDGDGEDDGVSYPQTAVWNLGLADEIVNVAVATSRAIGSRTVEQSLKGGTDPDGNLSLFDFAGSSLTPEQLNFDINLTAQVDRIIADFEEKGAPENAAVTLLVGANDLANVVAYNADLLDGTPSLEAILQLIPDLASTMAGIARAARDAAIRLEEAGVDTIVFLTSPIANVPLVTGESETIQQVADILVAVENALVGAALNSLALRPGFDATIETVDLAGLVEAVSNDPGNFNVQSFLEPYYDATNPYPVDNGGTLELFEPVNPDFPFPAPDDRTFFFDLLHPNANSHDLIAAFLNASLRGEATILGDTADIVTSGILPRLDVVLSNGGDDTIETGRGNDVVFAGLGNDTVEGGAGRDILSGGSGDDSLHGDQQSGGLFGRALFGSSDVLNGNDGDDVLDGGAGPDALFDGLGSDQVIGGAGADLLVHVDEVLLGDGPGDLDHFDGGGGEDLLLLILPDADERALVIAAVEGSRGFGGAIGDFAVPEIGLTVTDIEHVMIFETRGMPSGLPIAPVLADQLALADLWSAALPALEGYSVADVIYDSGLPMV